MVIDVKLIRVSLWRFSVFIAGTCFRFAHKHPCFSTTLFSFFFLYVFFPSVFRLLIYSSPLIICAYAYRKNSTKPEHQIQKKYDQTAELDISKNTHNKKKSSQNGRLNAEEKEESESDVLGKAENDLTKTQEVRKAENADDTWSKHKGESESDILDKAEYEDDEETQEEEDGQEDMPTAVEWTEQDERNLMDLGTSENERDKRLQSLIQKRRARKLLSMQVRNVIDIIRHPPNQVAPLVIARSNGPLNLINTLSDTDDLHMPGSAPSVLLPSRSPFDLPYDPFEERPDLTGDSSFEQEFVTADKKDFCRHESFFYGGHSGTRPDPNNLNSFMNAEKMKTKQPLKNDNLTSKEDTKCDNQVEIAQADSDRNLSSEDLSSYVRKSLASVQENPAKGAKESEHAQAPRYTSSKDLFNVHKRVLHTPAHSIASDLVVEVSEAGSPPTLSPPDEDSSHYDGDVERGLSSGSEDLSLHVCRMEEHGTRSLEGQESIPEVVEIEEQVVEEYEHNSPTSSDGNSSYENVVHHLNEKLNARRESNNVIMESSTSKEPCKPAEVSSGLQVENILSNQTNPMYSASGTVEFNECDSATTDQHGTSEGSIEVGAAVEEQGSSNTQAAEDVIGNTEMRTSDDVTLAAEQQAAATEEVPEVTSPKSVLPDTDLRDQITRLDSQPSDLADSASDVTHLANSVSQGDQIVTGMNPAAEANNLVHTEDEIGTVSMNNQAESSLSSSEALPLSNTLHSDDEFNGISRETHDPDSKGGSSTAESSMQNVYTDLTTLGVSLTTSAYSVDSPGGNTPVKSTDPAPKLDSQSDVPLPDMDTELHIHHITETCM